jgi:hypothetical protein
MKSIEYLISRVQYAVDFYSELDTREDWQTLKADVLAQQASNKQMMMALDDIRTIVLGRGDSVTKVQKVQDIVTRLNITKA